MRVEPPEGYEQQDRRDYRGRIPDFLTRWAIEDGKSVLYVFRKKEPDGAHNRPTETSPTDA